MKNKIAVLLLLLANTVSYAQYKPAGDKIKTKWAKLVDANNVLSEYPRPIMERGQWKNLNGLWNYAIQDAGLATPAKYDGKILVPFAAESSLSGVMKQVGSQKELWYETNFSIDSGWKGKDILLHFGAVDWKADVYINDIKVGSHSGGFSPFSFNITPFISGKTQKLVVKVWDPTNDGPQPRGKQVKNPEGIWYTPVTGIWQTVWLEPVNKKYIKAIRPTPDVDHNTISIATQTEGTGNADIVEVTILDGNKAITSGKAVAGQSVDIVLNTPKLWSPENPFLYDVKVKLISSGKTIDEIKSYCALRKITTHRDENGIVRMQLNNKDYFHFGPLDQGWWPDGLYTAPTDEALKYDIIKTKELGFNMIRKHVKVEPQRWYTHCDRMGILVWQDMPSGDDNPIWQMHQYFDGNELKRTAESEAIYKREWKEIMDNLYSYPCIVVWVPFNEAWGQFKTVEIAEWTKSYDPTRLVNSSSGGNHFQTADILDVHHYPGPKMPLYDARRVTVLGEYGGIGLPVQGHLWQTDKNWGYTQFKNTTETTDLYVKYAEELIKLSKAGYSGAVYTQTTDVEGEVNGFMTYDREIDKMDFERVNKVNKEVINSISE